MRATGAVIADLSADPELLEALRRNDEAPPAAPPERHRAPALVRVPRAFRRLLAGRADQLVQTGAIFAAQSFELDAGRCLLVLLGPPDAGKSFAAAWAMIDVFGGNGLWVDADALLDMIGRPDTSAELFGAGVVVVDDVGHADGSPDRRAATADVLEKVIKRRAQSHQAVILTSQLTRAGLAEWFASDRRDGAGQRVRADRFTQRLLRHGVEPAGGKLADLGCITTERGVVQVAFEGFNQPDLRARRLLIAERLRGAPTDDAVARAGEWNRSLPASGSRTVALYGAQHLAGEARVLTTGQPVVWVVGFGFTHMDDVRVL